MGSAWLACPIHPPKTCALPEHRQPPDRISNDAKKLARILSVEQHNTRGGEGLCDRPDDLNFESRPEQELNITCDLTTTGWVTPPSTHRPRSEIKYKQKNHWGEVLNFSFLKIIRRLLLFARLSYYFTPYNRLTDYSLQVHKLKKSSTLLSFWPAGFIPPPNDWKLTDNFFPISTLWARCVEGLYTCRDKT